MKPAAERRPASEPEAEQAPVEAAPVETPPVEQTPAEAAPAESAPVSRTPDVPEKKPAPPKRGMGRYRSGSRGSRSPTPSPSGPRIGKVETAESTAPSGRDGEDSDEAPASAPETTAPPTDDTSAPGTGGSASPRSRSIGSPVEHMIRNYTGVGRRTAEALVDRFGAEVFQVIDREPGRLTEVISAARARAVIAAREAERSGSGA